MKVLTMARRDQAMEAGSGQRLLSREAMVCAAVLGVCLLLTWPVADVGINDDWVYTLTAFDFARTGHFVFHGWASPLLGWQALWGALFARMFGASFTAVRLSMLPVALATAVVYCGVLRRFGLNRAHAIFGTLLLVLGPVFLPLSATFMTDVPSLLAIFVCVYQCQRAVDAETDGAAVGWLVAAAVCNVLLGTVRQVAWLGVLVVVPSCGWLLRRRRGVVAATVVVWVAGGVAIRQMLHWFAAQPYTAPERLIAGPLDGKVLLHGALQWVLAGATMCLLLLPVSVAGFRSVWPLRGGRAWRGGAVALVFLVVVAVLRAKKITHVIQFPWLGNTMDAHGILQGDPLFGSAREIPTGILLALLGLVALATWAGVEAYFARRRAGAAREEAGGKRTAAVLLLPFLAAYCVLLVPRAVFFLLFDRYLLEILAVALVFVLLWHQERVSARVPGVWVAALAVMAAVATAGTHDMFALDRAELRAIDEVMRAGVPRTEIRGGFAFDSTTQVLAAGHLNDPRIVNPAGAYVAQPPSLVFRGQVYCGYPFLGYVPVLHVRYVIAADASPCWAAAGFAPQAYRTWLPPARREVFVAVPLPGTRAPEKR